MKPSIINYWLAHAFGISAIGGVFIACVLVTRLYFAEGIFSLPIEGMLIPLLAYIPAGLLGLIFGFFPTWMIVGNIVSLIQGAPFRVGDTVCVLSGKYKGKVATVYEVWECRGQVRVDLGEEPKKMVEDVFCNVAVFKIKKAEPDSPARAIDPPDGSGYAHHHGQGRTERKNP